MRVCKKLMMNIINQAKRFKISCIKFSLFAILIASPSVQAKEDDEASLSFSGDNLVSLDSGTGERFSANQVALTLPLEYRARKNESFASYFHVDLTQFDWRGAEAAENDYIWLSMPIKYSQQRDRLNTFLVTLEPGFMTDGSNIGLDSVGINGSLVGRRLMRNGGYWQYGLMIDRAFGDYDLRPVIGIAFQASAKTWMELGFPELHVKHDFTRDLKTFFSIKPMGGVWKEEIEVDTAKQDETISYNNWQVGTGINFHWREKLWLNAEVGQLMNRGIKATDATGADIKGTPSQTLYWQVGGKLQF